MNANTRTTKVVAIFAALLIVEWYVRSHQSSSTGHTSWADSEPVYKHADKLHQQFNGIEASIPQSEESDDAAAVGEKLGTNGRPHLRIENIIHRHYPEPNDDGSHLTDHELSRYTRSIFDLGDTAFWRMECPDQHQQGARYEVLRKLAKDSPGIKYLFALDLYNSIEILPRLMSSIIQTIKFLGAENCGLSIIEGRSSDGTYKVLHSLHTVLEQNKVAYWLNQSSVDPHAEGVDRIAELSKLRNMALAPLRENPELFAEAPLTAFINDIAVCPDDILELLYQHGLQGAAQTCAMDWVDGGELFYDVWVSRSMSGNIFFEIPQDMSWSFSRNFFWDEPIAKDKYARGKPFQVFSCWGGMVVLDSVPFMRGALEFRRNVKGECYGGEPQTLASDLAKLGMSRVVTVPYVRVAYNNHEGAQVKERKGYVHEHVDVSKSVESFEEDVETERIRWRKPPKMVRCMPSFNDFWWVDPVYVPGRDVGFNEENGRPIMH